MTSKRASRFKERFAAGTAAAALIALLAVTPSPAQVTDDPGAAPYVQSGCAACHGADARGTALGPSLASGELGLEAFRAFVRRPVRSMPAYDADTLADDAVADIFVYTQAQRGVPMPAGRVDVGGRLFAANGCYSCHANEAQGGMHGPRLGPDSISVARFAWYVRHPSATMPPYSTAVMSNQDVADIRAFVASRPVPPPVDEIPLLAP